MSNGPKRDIAIVSEQAWQETIRLAKSAGKYPPPVALDNVAAALSIDAIRFMPLVSDAGLKKSGEVFEIVINTDFRSGPYPKNKMLSAKNGDWADVHAYLRFAIAHEIAHAIFLRAAKSDRQNALFVRNEKAIENACNILARILLLPSELITREIGRELFNPARLTETCRKCQVSPELLIRRLRLSDMADQYSEANGFIAFARDSEKISIEACHIFGVLARNRFHRALADKLPSNRGTKYRSLAQSYAHPTWLMDGQSIEDLELGTTFNLLRSSGCRDSVESEIPWGSGKVLPYTLACRATEQPKGFVLCLKLLGPVQEAGQKMIYF